MQPASASLPEPARRRLTAVGEQQPQQGPAAGTSTSGASAVALEPRAIQLPSSTAPAWAVLGDIRDSWRADHERCVEAVSELNAAGTRADLLLYGDSLTAALAKNQEAWRESFGGLVALPLGMKGSTVEQLTWRLVEGGEQPALPPRAAVFLIGVRRRRPAVPGLPACLRARRQLAASMAVAWERMAAEPAITGNQLALRQVRAWLAVPAPPVPPYPPAAPRSARPKTLHR